MILEFVELENLKIRVFFQNKKAVNENYSKN